MCSIVATFTQLNCIHHGVLSPVVVVVVVAGGGQVVVRTGIIANNPKHCPYPWKKASVHNQDIIKLVQADLPKKYQKTSFVLESMGKRVITTTKILIREG